MKKALESASCGHFKKFPIIIKKMVVTLDTALNEDYDGILVKDIMQWLLH